MSDNSIGLVKALGFVAWADERISPEERDLLRTVMDALAIPEARRQELCEGLRRAPATLEDIAAAFDDDTERRFALAQAIMLAGVDGPIEPREREKLGELAAALGIDAEELGFLYEAVEATVEAFPDPPRSSAG